MSSVFSSTSEFVGMLPRIGNKRIYAAMKKYSPLLDSTLLKKVNHQGKETKVILKDHGASVKIAKDGGAKTYRQQKRKTLTVDGVLMLGTLEIGADLVKETRSREGLVDHLVDQIDDLGSNLAETLNTLMHGAVIATPQATALTTDTSFTINEFGSLAPSMTYDVLDNTGAYKGTFISGEIAHNANVAGPHTVNVVDSSGASAQLGFAIALTDQVVPSGILDDGSDPDLEFASFGRAADASQAMYGLAGGGIWNWGGRQKAVGGAFDDQDIRDGDAQRQKLTRRPLDFVISNSIVEEAYIASFFDAGAHYMPGGSPDVRKYANVRFKNRPWLVDDTAPNTCTLVGKGAVQLVERHSFSITGLNSKKPPNDLTPFLDKDNHLYKFAVDGKYQMCFHSRADIFQLTGLTY